MSQQQELVTNFVAITGADEVQAVTILDATNWNLEQAVQLYFESTPPPAEPVVTTAASNTTTVRRRPPGTQSPPPVGHDDEYDEEGVRAPIPQVAQTLIDDDDDDQRSNQTGNFSRAGIGALLSKVYRQTFGSGHGNPNAAGGVGPQGGGSPPAPLSPVAGSSSRVRNGGRGPSSSSSSSSSSNQTGMLKEGGSLAKLFKPPVDIIFKGKFEEAKQHALKSSKWLLVNIQSDAEFPSHLLNRETWSNSTVREVIKGQFIFWQRTFDSEEGSRFQQLYRVHMAPYIAIVDPRTGECVKTWTGYVEPLKMSDDLTDFSSRYSVFDLMNMPPPLRGLESATPSGSHQPAATPSPPFRNSPPRPVAVASPDLVTHDDQTEEEMIQAAIQESLRDPHGEQPMQPPSQPQSQQDTLNSQENMSEAEMLRAAIAASLSDHGSTLSQNSAEPIDLDPPSPRAPSIDFEQFLAEDNTPDSTRVQIRLPNNNREVVRFRTCAPLAALYELCRQRVPDADTKPFKLLFLNKVLDDSTDRTLAEEQITNAAVSMRWDE